jgi:DNA-directed RNA polymerase III subunit RPC4
MTASGPFAMGPALAGNNPRRSVPRSNFTPTVATIGDDEVYSDPDEGVEIVDMENIHQMDWMAPESLRKERHVRRIHNKDLLEVTGTFAAHLLSYVMSISFITVKGDIDRNNALDLSDSEEEEELEDIMEHFAANANVEAV